EMPSISEKPRIVYIHSNFDIQQYSTQYELQSERKCLFFLNIINPFKDEFSTTNEHLHQTIVKILLKHLKAEIRSQYNCWPMYNIPSSSLSLKYLYTTNETNKHIYPSDIICKEYCHLHGICWQSIKSDKSLYDKMREYLNNFRLEIIDALNETKTRTSFDEQ
ncbi:unnamed protein product, partial [Adineta ricciae]